MGRLITLSYLYGKHDAAAGRRPGKRRLALSSRLQEVTAPSQDAVQRSGKAELIFYVQIKEMRHYMLISEL